MSFRCCEKEEEEEEEQEISVENLRRIVSLCPKEALFLSLFACFDLFYDMSAYGTWPGWYRRYTLVCVQP